MSTPYGHCRNKQCENHTRVVALPAGGLCRKCYRADLQARTGTGRVSKRQRLDLLYLAAIESYGAKDQCNQCIEEMAELTLALRHHARGREANVCEEIADVQIMAEQMSLLFGAEKVKRIKALKLKRLKRRLEEVAQ